ncbi:9771_t:CDS:2, partial [Paraglomus occultum]
HLMWKYVLRGNYQAPLNPNMKNCLEVSVGNGVWIKEMASQFPDCHFEGIDLDLSISNEDLPSNCTVTKGDFTALPYPDDHFDYIHCRLCFTWLPSNKIGPILDEFKRVTKSEGWIEELDLYPRNTGTHYDSWKSTWKLLNDSKFYDVKVIRSLGESLRTRNL